MGLPAQAVLCRKQNTGVSDNTAMGPQDGFDCEWASELCYFYTHDGSGSGQCEDAACGRGVREHVNTRFEDGKTRWQQSRWLMSGM